MANCPPRLTMASMRDSRRRLLSNQAVLIEPRNAEWLQQLRSRSRGDEIGHQFAGHRTGLEAVRAPSYIHQKAFDFGHLAHDRTVVRRHVADSGPLTQHVDLSNVGKESEDMPAGGLQERQG